MNIFGVFINISPANIADENVEAEMERRLEALRALLKRGRVRIETTSVTGLLDVITLRVVEKPGTEHRVDAGARRDDRRRRESGFQQRLPQIWHELVSTGRIHYGCV